MPLPRISSRTPLRSLLPEPATPCPSQRITLWMLSSARKLRHRTTVAVLAFLFLIFVSTYSISTAYPTLLFRSPQVHTPPSTNLNLNLFASPPSRKHFSHFHPHPPTFRPKSPQPSKPQIQLTPDEELAAITSFLTTLAAANVIPPFVDPTQPIDPQLVLDFDTRNPRAEEEVREMVDDVWTRNPVVVYAKHYSPISRTLKGFLESLRLHPAPTIIDVDTRDDAAILTPILARLTSQPDLPILLIGGKPLYSDSTPQLNVLQQLMELKESGELDRQLKEAGIVQQKTRSRRRKRSAIVS